MIQSIKKPVPAICIWCEEEVEIGDQVLVLPVYESASWSGLEDRGTDPLLVHLRCCREAFSRLRPVVK